MVKCQECGRSDDFDFYKYCIPCNSVHFRNNFVHWTSGDSNLDKVIQNSQLNATCPSELIEWIEYSKFENIELIAHGGFGSVYKAIWKDGPIKDDNAWDFNKSKWRRKNKKEVAVKKFRDTTNVSSDLLNEVNFNLKMNNENGGIETIRTYGVTRDPQNGEYAIVIQFKNGGNLRKMIKEHYSNLTWETILEILRRISEGLNSVHESKYYHKDLHSGNILNKILFDNTVGESVISDFGLCRPMNQSSTDKTPYGILPFVAPEVLRENEFTEAADIYGFGMIMSELISGETPFADREYDENLFLAICFGERPQIPEYTPEPYAELMKRCWDPIPTNRPKTEELQETFDKLLQDLDFNEFKSIEDELIEVNGEFKSIEDELIEVNGEFNDDESIEISESESESIEISEDESIELNENKSSKLSEDRKLQIKKAFSREREDKWKARLAELATNPIPLKDSQNLLTSKRLDYSQSLSLKLSVEDWKK
ncbi:kinase-like protein [Rhizophagus irregularis]|uniref:Kinase-like protein n=2 Tax=Rhizophagus irregularis TaxID=588596 RepID=A0A2N0QV66_9GLOM|nr:kinase-like protein [Rhizophagus irregularis]